MKVELDRETWEALNACVAKTVDVEARRTSSAAAEWLQENEPSKPDVVLGERETREGRYEVIRRGDGGEVELELNMKAVSLYRPQTARQVFHWLVDCLEWEEERTDVAGQLLGGRHG